MFPLSNKVVFEQICAFQYLDQKFAVPRNINAPFNKICGNPQQGRMEDYFLQSRSLYRIVINSKERLLGTCRHSYNIFMKTHYQRWDQFASPQIAKQPYKLSFFILTNFNQSIICQRRKKGEKTCICGLAEVLSPQKHIGTANRKSAKCHICGRPANLTNCLNSNLRICDIRNLFADPPPLLNIKSSLSYPKYIIFYAPSVGKSRPSTQRPR